MAGKGQVRGPARTADAAEFREACERHGITHHNCREKLAIGVSNFYALGNGDQPVSKKLKLLLKSMDAYAELHKQLETMRDHYRSCCRYPR